MTQSWVKVDLARTESFVEGGSLSVFELSWSSRARRIWCCSTWG